MTTIANARQRAPAKAFPNYMIILTLLAINSNKNHKFKWMLFSGAFIHVCMAALYGIVLPQKILMLIGATRKCGAGAWATGGGDCGALGNLGKRSKKRAVFSMKRSERCALNSRFRITNIRSVGMGRPESAVSS